jgi:hypothetical protein
MGESDLWDMLGWGRASDPLLVSAVFLGNGVFGPGEFKAVFSKWNQGPPASESLGFLSPSPDLRN